MNINKIKAYVGFAKKSKAIAYGVDSIREKKVYLVIYSKSLAWSSKQRCVSLKDDGIEVYEIADEQMMDIIENENVKAFGVKNQELAKAIKQFLA